MGGSLGVGGVKASYWKEIWEGWGRRDELPISCPYWKVAAI